MGFKRGKNQPGMLGFVILALLFLNASGALAKGISVRAYLDRNAVSVGDQFALSIEVSGSDASKVPAPKPPDLSKFAAFVGSSTSQSIQFVNGRMSASKTTIFFFQATAPGMYTIPPVQVVYKSKTYPTNRLTIQVRKKTATAPPPAPGARGQTPGTTTLPKATGPRRGDLFLRALVNKRTVYQNEPVVITYRIYTRVSVTGYGIKTLPKTAGFWAEEVPLPQRPQTRNEIYNGIKYVVADLKKMVLFPTAPGKKVIDPMVVTCQVRVRSRRHSRDIFDEFFNDDFFGREIQQDIKSQPITIQVLPLPEAGKPANFSGAVGQFRLKASLSKDTVKANEAVTLTIRISGSGNIKMLPEPKLKLPPDFEKYEPKVTQKINRTASGVSGFKQFEYVLIPRFPGEQHIAPISFSYFDPRAKTYRTLHSPEFVVRVGRGAQTAVSLGEGLSKEEIRLVGSDIRFIKTEPPEFIRLNATFYKTPLFWLLVFVPLLALGGAFGYKRYQDRLEENVAFARSQRANQFAKKRLQKAKKLLDESTQKEFFAEISRALLGFLADKFNLPPAGIMTDEVEHLMRERGVDEETIRKYLDCLNTCDFQRFAPANSTVADMQSCYNDASEAIVRLEKAI